jgi:hypothetical protein
MKAHFLNGFSFLFFLYIYRLYLLKLIDVLTRKEVLNNEQDMSIFILGLLNNKYTQAFNKILENNLLTEKEIKLKLILHKQLTSYFSRQTNFLSKHIY